MTFPFSYCTQAKGCISAFFKRNLIFYWLGFKEQKTDKVHIIHHTSSTTGRVFRISILRRLTSNLTYLRSVHVKNKFLFSFLFYSKHGFISEKTLNFCFFVLALLYCCPGFTVLLSWLFHFHSFLLDLLTF